MSDLEEEDTPTGDVDVVAGAPKGLRAQVWILWFAAAVAIGGATLAIRSLSMMAGIAKTAAAEAVAPIAQDIASHERADDGHWGEVAQVLKELKAQGQETHDAMVSFKQWRDDQERDGSYAGAKHVER